jgi:hypothetical protein
MTVQINGILEPQATSVPPEKSAKEQVEDLLQEMREAKHHEKSIPKTLTDMLLDGLSHKDFPALHCAHVQLRLNMESQNKKIDVFF